MLMTWRNASLVPALRSERVSPANQKKKNKHRSVSWLVHGRGDGELQGPIDQLTPGMSGISGIRGIRPFRSLAAAISP